MLFTCQKRCQISQAPNDIRCYAQRESSLAARKPSRASRSKKCHFAPFRPSYLDHICTRKLYPKLRFGSAMLSSERFFTLTALIKRKQSLAPLAPRVFFYCFFWRLTSVWLFSMLEKFPINLSESASARAFNYVFVSAYTRWECRRILNTFFFLVGAKRLYTRPRRSVGRLAGWSVGWSVFIFFLTFLLLLSYCKTE